MVRQRHVVNNKFAEFDRKFHVVSAFQALDRKIGIFRPNAIPNSIPYEFVSIPNRVLGIFRPPVPEGLLYLVFNVHLRLY